MSQTPEQFDLNNTEEDLSAERVKQFDWHSTALTIDNCRGSYNFGSRLGDELMQVLVLPTSDYFLPLLAQGGFPEYLIGHPQIWKSIFAEFVPLYAKEMDEFYEWVDHTASIYRTRILDAYESTPVLDRSELIDHLELWSKGYEAVRFKIHLKAWQDVLKMLAEQAGRAVAIELEQWVYRHYLSERYRDAMNMWWMLFNNAQTLPDFLIPLVDEIYDHIHWREYFEFTAEVLSLSRKYHNELNFESRVENVRYHHPPYIADKDRLEDAVMNTHTTAVLQLLARSLSAEQIEMFVEWAKSRYEGEILDTPDKLCEDELITTKIIFADFPSILDVNISPRVR
jgi:hypothetical protein